MRPLGCAWHLSYWWVLLGQGVSLVVQPFPCLSAIFSCCISVYQVFSIPSVLRSGAKLPPSPGFSHITNYFSSDLVLPEDGTQLFLGHLFSWNQLLKTAFCQASIALGLSNTYCFLFIRIRTVPTPFRLLRKHSFLYYVSQNFHLLFASQDWCPGVHILQSYWPLI